ASSATRDLNSAEKLRRFLILKLLIIMSHFHLNTLSKILQPPLAEYLKPIKYQTYPDPNNPQSVTINLISLPKTLELTDSEVLEALAMRKNEYAPDSIEFLEEHLLSRGYIKNDILAWREGRLLSTEDKMTELKNFKSGGLLKISLYVAFALIILTCSIEFLFSISDSDISISISADLSIMFSSVISVLGLIIIPPLFLWWFYRAYKNLSYIKGERLKFNPILAIGGHFIPHAQYLFPIVIAREIILSHLQSNETYAKNNRLLTIAMPVIWWAVTFLAFHFPIWYVPYDNFPRDSGLDWLFPICYFVIIVAAVFSILLISLIEKLQYARYKAIIGL
ncbi:MAG: DUF4328 domain-containing protein, partial [candidate division Zixibacteria bacterium]